MIINRPKKEDRIVKFYELPISAGFRWKDLYYIKIEESQPVRSSGETQYCNAVQLETGLLAHFSQTDLVEKIPMAVEVAVEVLE